MKFLVVLSGVVSLATPALCLTDVGLNLGLPGNEYHTTRFLGQLAGLRTDGANTLAGRADYGRLGAFGSFHDPAPQDVYIANAYWQDRFSISVDHPTTVFFYFDVRSSLSDLSSTSFDGSTTQYTSAYLIMNPTGSGDYASWYTQVYETSAFWSDGHISPKTGAFNGSIQAAAGGPPGYTRYLVGRLISGGYYDISATAECGFYGFPESPKGFHASGGCQTQFHWGGFAFAYGPTGEPASVHFGIGASGTDWSKPYGGAVAVPEPASWAMLVSGWGLAGAATRRRRVSKRPRQDLSNC